MDLIVREFQNISQPGQRPGLDLGQPVGLSARRAVVTVGLPLPPSPESPNPRLRLTNEKEEVVDHDFYFPTSSNDPGIMTSQKLGGFSHSENTSHFTSSTTPTSPTTPTVSRSKPSPVVPRRHGEAHGAWRFLGVHLIHQLFGHLGWWEAPVVRGRTGESLTESTTKPVGR